MSTREMECGYCGLDHPSSRPCPKPKKPKCGPPPVIPPDWAKPVRLTSCGLDLRGGPLAHKGASRYWCGPFVVRRQGPGHYWDVLEDNQTVSSHVRFETARWRATELFFDRLCGGVHHDDVQAILASPIRYKDWLPFKVLADKLADLGFVAEEQLVRFFIPKGV